MTTTINLTDALTTEDKTTVEDLAMGVCVASVASIADMLALTAIDGQSVNVEGYYGTGTGGGGIFTYDSSLMATNNGGTIILGWVRQCDYGTANVMWFGAKGDGVTDDSAAIQSAFDSIRYLTAIVDGETENAPTAAYTVKLIFPPGGYVITSPIDMTEMRDNYSPWVVEMYGAVIFGRTTGKTMFDLLGSRRCLWKGGVLIGEEATLCRTGIQIGRSVDGVSANSHVFENVEIKGYFSLACFYNLASEGLVATGMSLRNYLETTDSYCLIQDGESYFGGLSDYTTTQTMDTAQSFNRNVFFRLDARKLYVGSPVWLGGTASHTFDSFYAVSYDSPAVICHIGIQSAVHELLTINGHVETDEADTDPLTGITNVIKFTSTDLLVIPFILKGFTYKDHKPHCGESIFSRGANVDEITIVASHLDIGGLSNNSGQTIFDDETKFRFSGYMRLDSLDWQLDSIQNFTGTLDVNNATAYTGINSVGFTLQDTLNTVNKGETQIMATEGGAATVRFKDTDNLNAARIRYLIGSQKMEFELADGSVIVHQPLAYYCETPNTTLGSLGFPWGKTYSTAYNVNGNNGVSGTFTTVDSKTITVELGIVTSIV